MCTVFAACASTRKIDRSWWNTMPPGSAALSFSNYFAAQVSPLPSRFLHLPQARLLPPYRMEMHLRRRRDLRRNTPPDNLEAAAFHQSKHIPCAPLAQLDRASGYEPEGREFESLGAHHKSS
jgi:hypothetical protein